MQADGLTTHGVMEYKTKRSKEKDKTVRHSGQKIQATTYTRLVQDDAASEPLFMIPQRVPLLIFIFSTFAAARTPRLAALHFCTHLRKANLQPAFFLCTCSCCEASFGLDHTTLGWLRTLREAQCCASRTALG